MTLLRPRATLVLRVAEARIAMLEARAAYDAAAYENEITETHTAYERARDAYITALELHFAASIAAEHGDIETQMAIMLELRRDAASRVAANDPRSNIPEAP